MEPRSPALQADSLLSEPPGKPKNYGVDSLSFLQGIFLTQELNMGFLHCRQILYISWATKEAHKKGYNIYNRLYTSRNCHTDTEPDPVGLLGTRPFCVPLFDYRKQLSLSFHELPWVPVGWGKQLLIRGGGARPGISSQEQPWGKVLIPHQWTHTTISLSYFAETETPSGGRG